MSRTIFIKLILCQNYDVDEAMRRRIVFVVSKSQYWLSFYREIKYCIQSLNDLHVQWTYLVKLWLLVQREYNVVRITLLLTTCIQHIDTTLYSRHGTTL